MTENISRQPKGIPVGGQFAATTHSEPGVALPTKVTPFHDADGTDWDFDGDEYTDIYKSFTDSIEARVTTDIREGGARATVVDFRGRHPLEVGPQAHFDSLDQAKAHAKAVRERAAGYDHTYISPGFQSPWGEVQETKALAVGIDAVYTAGHGGLKLGPKRAEEVDTAWRERSSFYEEDCAWSKAAVTHHQDLPADYVAAAHQTARQWYPDEYNAIVGKDPAKYGVKNFTPVTAEESHILRDREFLASRAATHVRVHRVDTAPAGHPGMVAATVYDIPADGRDDEENQANARTILVPKDEWDMPYSAKRTVPKNDKYEVLEPAGV
ncbi:hypothetical protein Achl_4216 (plasmid) [Pseudarthrobacter chlorophenolicus A6]|uniref:DUF7007 domain-containing protein n=1 Tax=Pseudarthrobacter chlorophenolicus (strain ATCC 700700 / DSM 12829 / CIP 107037 / JCM 12360 / KCTC 9906 / NCIMB 13794 / A6) TaxID=452863 RepID=B8HIC0_PSECP|nr:hypothetical protein [Pseudarthrobacter chlorophenolicus]ACL42167.1 hypothetical protein Achl_4216 [Pseudarthrobacter chlorophenolicus A6]SDQ14324.1 hypothetical protein SAMN04489738_0274 [Pseudarthrobacter chlorophenolicus]